jgi:hypothetical protein
MEIYNYGSIYYPKSIADLRRISDPALAPIDSFTSEAFAQRPRRRIDTPKHSQETLWEEVVSLDIWDYLPGRLTVNDQRRSIDLNAQLKNALDHWVAIREGLYFQPKDGGNRDDALFLSCNGRRLSGTDIFRILQGYAEIAGVSVSPDRVRHGAITAFLDVSGGDVR